MAADAAIREVDRFLAGTDKAEEVVVSMITSNQPGGLEFLFAKAEALRIVGKACSVKLEYRPYDYRWALELVALKVLAETPKQG